MNEHNNMSENNNLSIIHPDLLPLPEPPIQSENKISNMPYDDEFGFRDSIDMQSPKLFRSLSSNFCESGCISSPSDSERNTNEYLYDIVPPVIPTFTKSNNSGERINKKYDIGNGDMSYIEDRSDVIMLENAWKAITLTENWDFVSQPIGSFSMSNDKRINIISNKMVELGYDGHSGCSFGCTMRNMQYLVQNGEENFKNKFNEKKPRETYNPIINIQQNTIQQTYSTSSFLEVGPRNNFGNMTLIYGGGF
jgi:hypothetical protein